MACIKAPQFRGENYGASRVTNVFYLNFNGIINELERRYFKTDSPAVRKEIEKYMNTSPCKICCGNRLKKESLAVKVNGKNISEISAMSINKTLRYFENLKLDKMETMNIGKVVSEIKNRLGFLVDVGLDYLTLNRSGTTLAGGEAQRIRLALQIGSSLTGVLYILDEPTTGLHFDDIKKLLDVLNRLVNGGNTVVVIEHNLDVIKSADYIIDLGLEGGDGGGKIVFAGTPEEIVKCKESYTGIALREFLGK